MLWKFNFMGKPNFFFFLSVAVSSFMESEHFFCTSDRQRAEALGAECWNKSKWV